MLIDATTFAPLTAETSLARTGSITHHVFDPVSSRLVVLSEDETGTASFPLVQIFDLLTNLAVLNSPQSLRRSNSPSSIWRPRLLAETRIQHGRKPFPVAAVATTPGLAYLACSLSSGAVLLLRNLVAALDAAPPPTSHSPAGPAVVIPKFKVAHQAGADSTNKIASSEPQEPVTALGFSYAPSTMNTQSLYLFMANLFKVMRYTVLGKGAGSPPITLDDIGAPLDCSTMISPLSISPSHIAGDQDTHTRSQLLIARPEALYVVGPNGRGACYAYEGPKAKILFLMRSSQLVIFSPPLPSTQASSSGTVRRFAASGLSGEATKVSIFDLQGKFLSYTGLFPGAIQAAFADPAASRPASSHVSGREDVCLLSDSGTVHRLEEKSLREKLDTLFSRNLYVLAAQLVRSHFSGMSSRENPEASAKLSSLLAEIWVKYGDHLYEEGDYEGSMKMGYLKSVSAAAAATNTLPGRRSTRPASRAKFNGQSGRFDIGASYIIRRFLDAQRIPLLTLYLQELHRRGLANPDHTTLLLNCFTKMKDIEALDRFIRRSHIVSASHVDDENDHGNDFDDEADDGDDDEQPGTHKQDRLPFDLATAIKVCRSANYFTQAAYLAKKFDAGDEYLRIKIEDTQCTLEALEWLRTREAPVVEGYLRSYAGALLAGAGNDAEAQRETTDLLIEVCSGAYRPYLSNSSGTVEQAARAATVKKDGGTGGVLRYLTKTTTANQSGTNGRLPSHDAGGNEAPVTDNEKQAIDETQLPPLPYEVPSPKAFFTHFLRFPKSFKRFLETVALARWGQVIEDGFQPEKIGSTPTDGFGIISDEKEEDQEDVKDQKAVWNALLEIYLRDDEPDAPIEAGTTAQRGKRQAFKLLQQHAKLPYDPTHALILCEQEGFIDGVVLLYERMGLYEDILRLWIDKSSKELGRSGNIGERVTEKTVDSSTPRQFASSDRVLKSLNRYAHLDSSLYPLVITYLISNPLLLSHYHRELKEILTRVEEEKLMSTLQIIQLLSKTQYANVGLIKNFLQRAVQEEQSEIEADQRLIDSYRSEAESKTKEMEALANSGEPRVFQSNWCNACGGQLDLPAVHFMCKHSYHVRCLGEAESECPACAASYGVIREIRHNNEELASRHEL